MMRFNCLLTFGYAVQESTSIHRLGSRRKSRRRGAALTSIVLGVLAANCGGRKALTFDDGLALVGGG